MSTKPLSTTAETDTTRASSKEEKRERTSHQSASALCLTDPWFLLVTALVFMTIVSIYVLPQKEPFVYARDILGLLFVVYLPGYSLTKVLFHKRGLEVLERIALSIALSLAVASITGVVLNYTPWGIRLDPIVGSLSVITITFSTIAQLLRLTFS